MPEVRSRAPRISWRVVGTWIGDGQRLGPTTGLGVGKPVRMPLYRAASRTKVPIDDDRTTHLEVQLGRKGRATWIALQSPDGLTADDLRRFPWKTLLAVADAADRGLRETSTIGERERVSRVLAAHENGRRLPKPPTIAKRPGRGGHPDDHYQAIANRYKALRADGVTNPTTTIARERQISRDTAAGWVRGARDRGYLPPARPGRAG